MAEPNFRLAIRHEGPFINAYFAPMGTMDGAVLIGSIRTNLCRQNDDVFTSFKALMSSAMSTAVKNATGSEVMALLEQDAPEHERAGHA
jgi:hypothetical protein